MTAPSPARIAAVFPLFAVIMFGMGLTLTPADFFRAITLTSIATLVSVVASPMLT